MNEVIEKNIKIGNIIYEIRGMFASEISATKSHRLFIKKWMINYE